MSRGRVVEVEKGYQTDLFPSNLSSEINSIAELRTLSLLLQSFLYAELSITCKPYINNNIVPFTLNTTEISLCVDIGPTMTNFSPSKSIAAMTICTGLVDVFANCGVRFFFYVFADRGAIWSLTDPGTIPSPFDDLIRVIDSIRTGQRIGSCPLDMAITANKEFEGRNKIFKRGNKQVSNHVTIIISDFVSSQVIDRARDWGEEQNLGKCVLIAFKTPFDAGKLKKSKIDESEARNCLLPVVSVSDKLIDICPIDSDDIIKGFVQNSDMIQLAQKATKALLIQNSSISSSLSSSSLSPTSSPPTKSLISSPPSVSTSCYIPVWSTYNLNLKNQTNNVFIQTKPYLSFPFLNLVSSIVPSKVSVPNGIETSPQWFRQRNQIISRFPFCAISHNIATSSFAHVLIPNKAPEKELNTSTGKFHGNGELNTCNVNASNGEECYSSSEELKASNGNAFKREINGSDRKLWTQGQCISSGPCPHLFLKKSELNQKAYSISIVIDSTKNIFSLLNRSHTMVTVLSILNSFALIPGNEEISIDVIAASGNGPSLIVRNHPASCFGETAFISDIYSTLLSLAGVESGIGTGLSSAFQLPLRRKGVGRRIIALTDGIISIPSEVIALRNVLADCEANGIPVLGIGLGIAPVNINLLFPNSLYAPDPADLGRGLAGAFGIISNTETRENKILPKVVFQDTDERKMYELNRLLLDPTSVICKHLSLRIKEKGVSTDFVEPISDKSKLVYRVDDVEEFVLRANNT